MKLLLFRTFLLTMMLALSACERPVNSLINKGISGYIDPILSGPTAGYCSYGADERREQVSSLKSLNPKILCSNCALIKMTGHRGGGDPAFCSYPENSLLALRAYSVCGDNQKKSYLEFDINSTRDGKLVVFHGPQLKKMISFEQNRSLFKEIGVTTKEQFKKLTISDLDYSFLKKLDLMGVGNQKIPLLDDYLKSSIDFGLHLKMVADVKYVAPDLFETLAGKLRSFGMKHKITVKSYITSTRYRKLGKKAQKQMCKHMPVAKCNLF